MSFKVSLTLSEIIAFQVIDRWLGYRLRYTDIPGYQVCVRKKGQIIFSKAYGKANLNTKEKYTIKHLGHVASHSKMFTSCALHMLQEQGALQLTDLLIKHIPQFKKHKDKRFKEITLRDLLANRSGIFRDGIDADFWALERPFLSREQLIEEVLQAPLVYNPNTETKYSNIGFGLLGLVVEAASGRTYNDFIKQQIITKLPGTKIAADYNPTLKPFAEGHTKRFYEGQRLPMRHVDTQALAAATGFCATAEGTTHFVHEFLWGKSLVSKATQRELLSLKWPMKNCTGEDYGLGLEIGKGGSFSFIGHSGGYPGFISQTRHLDGTEYTLSVIINTNEGVTFNIIRSIAEILRKIETSFTPHELKKALVTDPLMNRWGSSLFVISPEKALSFNLETWNPFENIEEFTAQKNNLYVSQTITGYSSVGEKVIFHKDKAGRVTSLQFGGHKMQLEIEFLRRSQKALLSEKSEGLKKD